MDLSKVNAYTLPNKKDLDADVEFLAAKLDRLTRVVLSIKKMAKGIEDKIARIEERLDEIEVHEAEEV